MGSVVLRRWSKMSRATAPGSSCAFVVTCSRHRRRRLTGEPCEPVSVRAHKVTQTAARKGAATAGFTGTGLEPVACKERPLWTGVRSPHPPGAARPAGRGPAGVCREPGGPRAGGGRPRGSRAVRRLQGAYVKVASRRRRAAARGAATRTRRCSNASTRGPLRCTYTYC